MGDNAYKLAHIRARLCVDCSRPASPGRIYCEIHLETTRLRAQRNKQERKETGRCPECSTLLEDDCDSGHVVCQNCREKKGMTERMPRARRI